MSYPNLVPSYVTIGQREQELIIEYPIDLPRDLMTATILFPDSGGEAMARAPTTSLGPRTVKIKLPVFTTYGIYTVIPRFPANPHPKFPQFKLRVLSAVETLINVLAPEEDPYHATAAQATTAVIAPLLAYLIQNEQQGVEEDPYIVDQVLSQIFPCLEEPIVSISEYLCGKYANKGETLLHFCVRHHFSSTCEVLTHQFDRASLQKSLALRGFDGKTPLDISEDNEDTDLYMLLKFALNKADNAQYQLNKGQSSSSAQKTKSEKSHGGKFGLIRNVLKKMEKKMESSDHMDKLSSAGDSGGSDLVQPLIEHLKLTALYSAEIIQSYQTVDKEFGTISLQIGDIAYITREEDQQWCTGIVNDKYCRFPRQFLRIKKKPSGAGSNRIPSPEEMLESKQIHHLEELEALVDQQKKFADYAREKQIHHAKKENRLSYLSPVTRSCSVESGLDEISNCSPLLKRAALPELPKKSRQGIPLPRPPSDEDDDMGEYEPVDIAGGVMRPLSPTLPPRVARPNFKPPASSASPRSDRRQQSPLVNRREVRPIPMKSDTPTKNPSSVDKQSDSVQGSGNSSTPTNRNSAMIISPKSSDSNVQRDTPHKVATALPNDTARKDFASIIINSTNSSSSIHGGPSNNLKKSIISTKSSASSVNAGSTHVSTSSVKSNTSTTTSEGGAINDGDYDTDEEYEDVMAGKYLPPKQNDQDEDDYIEEEYDDLIYGENLPSKQSKAPVLPPKQPLSPPKRSPPKPPEKPSPSSYVNVEQIPKKGEVTTSETKSPSAAPAVQDSSSTSSTCTGSAVYGSPSTGKKIPPPLLKKPTKGTINTPSETPSSPSGSVNKRAIPVLVKTPLNQTSSTSPSSMNSLTKPTPGNLTPPTKPKVSPTKPPTLPAKPAATATSENYSTSKVTSVNHPVKKSPATDDSNSSHNKQSPKPPPPTRTNSKLTQASDGVQEISKKFEQRAWRY